MALQELILSASSGLTCLHDLRTGSLLTSFKSSSQGTSSDISNLSSDFKSKGRATEGNITGNEKSSSIFRKTTDFVEGTEGTGGLVLGVVAGGKAALNVWSFQKEAPLQRFLTPVKLACIALSKTGTYLAGGAHDGRILLWELSSGALLASFDAHYRGVTCLAWTDDDAALISGGDDSVCHLWSLPMMLCSSDNPHLPVAPYVTFSDHTLPVTDICISFGRFPRIRVLTASLDGSCKIWDPLLVKHHPLLSSFAFPSPAQITQVAFDALERAFFAGSWNATTGTSKVYRVDLYRRVRAGEDATEEAADSGRSRPYEALGGGGRGDVERVASSDQPGRTWSTPESAHERISSMSLSSLSSHLLVGTSIGSIHILSLPSLQAIRHIVPSQSNATASLVSPIAFISTLLKPPDLVSRTGSGSNHANGGLARDEGLQPRPVANQLSRNLVRPKDMEEHVVYFRIGNHQDLTEHIIPPFNSTAKSSQGLVPSGSIAEGAEQTNHMQSLQDENVRLREQLARSIAINDKMWEGLVDRTLGRAKQGIVWNEQGLDEMLVDAEEPP